MSRLPGENLKKKFFFFFSNYYFENLNFDFFNHDISKTIPARSLKLGQLAEEDK